MLHLKENPELILHCHCKTLGREGASIIPSQSWCAQIQHAASTYSPCASGNWPISHHESNLWKEGSLPDPSGHHCPGTREKDWRSQQGHLGDIPWASSGTSVQPTQGRKPTPN